MALTNLSQVTSSGIHTLSNYTTHNINSTGIITATSFSGNLSSASGISTFAEIRVTGNLTVEGTTTTLDSTLTEVDRLEIGANTAAVGLAVTQSGTGHVATFEGGNFGIGTNNPRTNFQVGAFGSGGDSNIQLATGTSGASNILFGDGSGGTDYYKGFIKYNHSTDNLELYATDDIIHYTGGSEKLRITSAGNVGIGTDTPGAKLEVRDGSSQGIIVRCDSTQATDTNKALRVRNNSDTNTFHVSHKGQGYFAGSVGIGTDNPESDQLLTIHGTSNYKAGIRLRQSSTNIFKLIPEGGTGNVYYDIYGISGSLVGDHIFRVKNGQEKFRIKSDGNVGIGTDNPFNATGYKSITLAGSTGGAIAFREGATTRWEIYGDNSNGIRFYDRTNTAERLRITNAGVTQITKGTSGGATANTDAALILDNSSHTYIQFRTPSDKEQGILFGDVQDNNVGSITYGHSSNALSFTTNANERLRIDSKGQASLRGTTTAFDGTGAIAALQMYYETNSGQASIGPYSNGGSTHLSFYTNSGGAAATEKVRITSTGDVGINCTPHSNAGINLHIHGDNTTSEIRLTNTTTGTGANGSYIQQGGNTLYIGNSESGNTVFEVSGSEKLRIATDGDLTHTGSDNVEYKMKCGTSSGNNIIAFLNSSGTTRGNITYDSDNNFLFFNVNQSERLRITSAGQLNLAGNMQFTAATPELEFNNGGPRFRVPAANTLTIHTGGGLGATSNERLRITSSGEVNVGGSDVTQTGYVFQVSKDLGTPSASGTGLARFKNANSTYSQDLNLLFNNSKDIIWTGGSGNGGMTWKCGTRGHNWEIGGVNKFGIGPSSSTLNGTTDGVFNINTTDGRGSFIRFQENGTTKVWVGSAEGMGVGDQDDACLMSVDNIYFRNSTDSYTTLTVSKEGRLTGNKRYPDASGTLRSNPYYPPTNQYQTYSAPSGGNKWLRFGYFGSRGRYRVTFNSTGGYYSPGSVTFDFQLYWASPHVYVGNINKLSTQYVTQFRVTTDSNGNSYYGEVYVSVNGNQTGSHIHCTAQVLGMADREFNLHNYGYDLSVLSHTSGNFGL